MLDHVRYGDQVIGWIFYNISTKILGRKDGGFIRYLDVRLTDNFG